jgi:hypothetical protein
LAIPLWALAIILLAERIFFALTVRWCGYGEHVAADPSSGAQVGTAASRRHLPPV